MCHLVPILFWSFCLSRVTLMCHAVVLSVCRVWLQSIPQHTPVYSPTHSSLFPDTLQSILSASTHHLSWKSVDTLYSIYSFLSVVLYLFFFVRLYDTPSRASRDWCLLCVSLSNDSSVSCRTSVSSSSAVSLSLMTRVYRVCGSDSSVSWSKDSGLSVCLWSQCVMCVMYYQCVMQ